MVDLKGLTIQKAHEAMKAGEYSAVDLAKAYLNEIKDKNEELNAYLEVFDDVEDQAKEADKKFADGSATLMTGIPVSIKDNILFKGHCASAASKILEGYTATYDATVVKKLKEAGAVILGRTNMDEFAMGASTENSAYGPTKNPHDTSRVSGGSSGGSVAAVAAGMALAALGSDTNGSIRQPSAFCGVVGLRPTYGNVSRHGLMAMGSSLDVISPTGKSVSDVEVLYEAIKGQDKMDSTSLPEGLYQKKNVSNPVIGIPNMKSIDLGSSVFEITKLPVIKNTNSAKDHLEKLGYKTKVIDMPSLKYAVPSYYIITPAEISANLARFDGVKFGLHESGENLIDDYFKTRGKGFGTEVKRRILLGTYVLSAGYHDAYYDKANAVRSLIAKDFEEAFNPPAGGVDIILMPTAPGPAFKIGEKANDPVAMYLEDVFTGPASLSGLPAISLPFGSVSEEGKDLPLGIQLIAPHQREDLLFQVGKKFLGED